MRNFFLKIFYSIYNGVYIYNSHINFRPKFHYIVVKVRRETYMSQVTKHRALLEPGTRKLILI